MRRIEVYEVDSESKASTLALTLLRVGVGCILMAHGWQKLTSIPEHVSSFAGHGIPNPKLAVYLAILGEFFGGLGLTLGALTPLAALGVVLDMGSAIYFVHRGHGLFEQGGGWEYPITLLLVGLFFLAHGAGPLSVDGVIAAVRRRSFGVRRRHDVAATTRP